MSALPRREKTLQLLADRALEGLEPLKGAELESLLAEEPDLDPDALDLAAAELELDHLEREGLAQPPQELLQRLRTLPALLPAQSTTLRIVPRSPESGPASSVSLSWLTASGWITAAALVLCWLLFLAPRSGPSLETLYEQLRSHQNTLSVSWQDQKSGDLVWHNERQEGYMRLVGLERNDPKVSQYQLWIFDENQLEATPIDGGVFDVTGTEVIVPIHAKLRVKKPYLFAITIEQPGGVPRSAREKIVQIAQVPKGP
ncbi:MAG: anti-sigma factor [Planctomycetes bacterium]|nr:anti-sigma factor [Planctomycetota bacterium]